MASSFPHVSVSSLSSFDDMMDAAAASTKRPRRHFTEHFTNPEVDNLRVASVKACIYPQLLMEEFPLNEVGSRTVKECRAAVSSVLSGSDDRLVVVVGPCSIHDPQAAMEYAGRLRVEGERLKNDLIVMMRVYFEKPRTTVGWKGLISDPHLDESYDINQGLKVARSLLTRINALQLPCACEFLDVLVPQYIADTVGWGAIGARTTESQLHRVLASGLSMPVGFKNGTSGDVQVAIDAVRSSHHQHCFLSITKQGLPAIVLSMGNQDTHVVLRGGAIGTNYDEQSIAKTASLCREQKVNPRIMVDCSHGNSLKQFQNQKLVAASICDQLSRGSDDIMGVMIESHLLEGRQDLPAVSSKEGTSTDRIVAHELNDRFCFDRSFSGGVKNRVLSELRYGVSITDGCLGWDDTVKVLDMLSRAVQTRREVKKAK